MKIASWNIAGGHTVKSKSHFDYEDEDVSYYVRHLAAIDPDVICLQEVHMNAAQSTAQQIAEGLNGYQVSEFPLHDSHIDDNYKMGLAILTRGEFEDPQLHLYPPPEFDLYFNDGRRAAKHDKGLQTVRYGGNLIANTHMLPLIIFGYDYRYDKGRKFAGTIDNAMAANLGEPLIFCGDFGASNAQASTYKKTIGIFKLQNALPAKPTYHAASEVGGINAPDCIFFSTASLERSDAGIIITKTDHYLCWADIKLSTISNVVITG